MDEVIREGLDCAQEFLEGLLEHLGLDGYYDPKAGHVSTQFVLDRINDARNVCDQIDGDGCDIPGCDHKRSNRGYDMRPTDG